MKIATLFSGIGAPEQGAMRVYGDKLETVFACEFDKFARQSYEANYDIAPEHFHKDVNDLDATQYKGKVDILVGGSPCQAFSIAGLREGTSDERGQLIYQYIRVVEECKPEVIVYENVKGMMSIGGGRTIKEFVQALRDIGYYCHYDVINTKDYGVPQNRERLFLVGFLDHEAYHRFEFAPKMKLEKRLKDVLESDVDEKYYLSDKVITGNMVHKERHSERGNGFAFEPKTENDICGCLATKYGNRQTDTYLLEPQINTIGLLDCKGTDQIRRVYGTDGIAETLTTMQGDNQEPKILAQRGRENGQTLEVNHSGTSNSLTTVQRDNYVLEPYVFEDRTDGVRLFADECCGALRTTDSCGDKRIVEPSDTNPMIFDDYNGNLKTDGLACTLTVNCGASAPINGQKVVTSRIRKLTPRECLRLQDFSDTFIQTVSDSQMYKQAGNSMSVNILEMIFNQIEKAKSNAPTNTLMDFMGETA